MSTERRTDQRDTEERDTERRTDQHDTEEIAREDDDQGGNGSLMPSGVSGEFRSRWESIQTTFVDDPGSAVSQADDLVGEVMDRLRATFEDQRSALEAGWSDDSDASSTEELRNAFRRYRSFFERLLET